MTMIPGERSLVGAGSAVDSAFGHVAGVTDVATRSALPSDPFHSLKCYSDETDLVEVVGASFAPVLQSGRAAVVIGRPRRHRAIVRRLEAMGIDTRIHRVEFIDVRHCLDTVLSGGVADADRFRAFVREVTSRGRPNHVAAVCSETTDFLLDRGSIDAAIAIERLWADHASPETFSLLCCCATENLPRFDSDEYRVIASIHSRVQHSLPPSAPPTTRAHRKILVVDDHPMVGEALARILSTEPDLVLSTTAADSEGALAAIRREAPDLAIVDIALGSESGVDLIEKIRTQYPHVRVLVLSMHDDKLYAERVLRLGASGYVTKLARANELLAAIRTVLRGEIYLSETQQQRLLKRIGRPAAAEGIDAKDSLELLTDREMEVYRMIGAGLSTKEIATKLHVSAKTVETHRVHIKEKLGIHSVTELIVHASTTFARGRGTR